VPAQTLFSEAAIVILTGKTGLTIMVIVLDVAGFPVVQVSLEVNKQVTLSASLGMYVKLMFVAPFALILFTCHWNEGVIPPFTGIAVKSTEVPAQTGFAAATIETLTGMTGCTVM
jgi:hypothetical protein